MGASRPPPRIWGVVAALGVGALGLACKVPGGAQAPEVADDIAEIEARLDSNESELVAEGIMVAQASPAAGGEGDYEPPVTDQEPSPPAPAAEEVEREIEADEDAGDAREEKRADRAEYRQRWLSKRKAAKDDAEQCKRVCDLAEATCALADKICDLAERHPDELRYERACQRAEDQCELASEACTACAS